MQITKTCNYDCGVFLTLYVIIRIKIFFFSILTQSVPVIMGLLHVVCGFQGFCQKKIKVWNWIDLKDQADRGGPPCSSSLQVPEGPFQGFQLHTIYLNSGFRPRITLVKCVVKCWVHSLYGYSCRKIWQKKSKKKNLVQLIVQCRSIWYHPSPTNKPFSKI